MKNKILAFCLLILTLLPLAFTTVSATDSYQTYTYSIDGFALASPHAYSPMPNGSFDSFDIGLVDATGVKLKNPTDLFVGPDKSIYIADSDNNRIVVLDEFYKFKFAISTFDNGDDPNDALVKPRGVFANDQYIYVCDTANSRIVKFDLDGNFVKIIGKPRSSMFGTDTSYMPIAVVVDQYDRIFVVSEFTTSGVIVMTDDGVFTGYIGAQKVAYSVFEIFWRRFQTAEQRAQSVSFVSVEFNNIAVDADGFIYVTTDEIDPSQQQSSIQSNTAAYSPVKKLNSAGDEIMKRNGFFGPGGEVDINGGLVAKKGGPSGPSKIVDVAIGEEGTWSILDQKRSKVFTYDQNGNLLFAFGDIGSQIGNLENAVSFAYQGDNLLVLDSTTTEYAFTVYERTDYGDLLIKALACENNRDYDQAIEYWLDVLKRNNNFDAAYIGVGKAYYREGDYDTALKYFQAAYDTENYSLAFQEIRKNWIEKFIILIPIAIILVCFVWIKVSKFAARKNKEVALTVGKRKYWQELIYVFHLVFHPFDGFWDLKHEKRGSVRAGLTILGVVILSFFYQSIGRGYIVNPRSEYSTIVVQVVTVVVPLMLFVIANWCLTTLFDGEGSFKDIFIVSSYSLAPLPLFLIVSTIFSNVVTAEEASIISFVTVIGFIWAIFLLFFGTMVTHDYTLGKNILMILFTILGMLIIIFVALLFTSLVGKMASFVSSIIVEVNYRL